MPASKPSTGPNIIVVIFLAVAVLMFAISAISAVAAGARWPGRGRPRVLSLIRLSGKRPTARCITGRWSFSLCRTAPSARSG